MISMIKWQCPSCYHYYCYYYYVLLSLLSLFLIIIIFMMCRFSDYAGFTWSSRHAGVVRFLLGGCYGRWFVYVKQHTASCWPLRAGGMCTLLLGERVSQTWIPVGIECWSIRSGKYPWCSDLSLCGKNMHWMKRFVLLICKLSSGVVTLLHFLPKL